MAETKDQIAPVVAEKPPTELVLQKFYDTELLEVPEQAKHILEDYSKIPPDDVMTHIFQVRDQAWKTFPYPCIGQFRFLEFGLSKSPEYSEIVKRLKEGEQLLDVGCCLGQDLRQLVVDGVKPENLYATDLHGDFWEFGYDLFKDRDKFNSLFLPADIFDHNSVLWQLQGRPDIIYAGSLLHLFDRKHQVIALTHMIKLLRSGPEVMIVGRMMGNVNPGEITFGNSTLFQHNVESFKKMFHEASDKAVGEYWETSVKSETRIDDLNIKHSNPYPEGAILITFVARRLARLDASTSHNFVF